MLSILNSTSSTLFLSHVAFVSPINSAAPASFEPEELDELSDAEAAEASPERKSRTPPLPEDDAELLVAPVKSAYPWESVIVAAFLGIARGLNIPRLCNSLKSTIPTSLPSLFFLNQAIII